MFSPELFGKVETQLVMTFRRGTITGINSRKGPMKNTHARYPGKDSASKYVELERVEPLLVRLT